MRSKYTSAQPTQPSLKISAIVFAALLMLASLFVLSAPQASADEPAPQQGVLTANASSAACLIQTGDCWDVATPQAVLTANASSAACLIQTGECWDVATQPAVLTAHASSAACLIQTGECWDVATSTKSTVLCSAIRLPAGPTICVHPHPCAIRPDLDWCGPRAAIADLCNTLRIKTCGIHR